METPKEVSAVDAVDAPVPPLAIARAVPLQLLLLIELKVDNEPNPKFVRAVAAERPACDLLDRNDFLGGH